MDLERVERIAAQLLDVRTNKAGLIEPHLADGPQSEAEAYAIQARVSDLLGAEVAAWKVGGPLDGPPKFARVFKSDVSMTPSRLDASTEIGIECEIAFRLGQDLPAKPGGYTALEVQTAVAAVLPLVETVSSRLVGFVDAPVLWKLADNQVNLGFVLGAAQSRFEPAMWQQAQMTLFADGALFKSYAGANPGGDCMELLAWLATRLPDYGCALKAGDVVTTGSYTGMDFFKPGRAIRADFGPLGAIEVTI